MSGTTRHAGLRILALRTAAIASLTLASACTMHMGENFSADNVPQIRSGVTTKQGVTDLIGPPFQRTVAANGDETWGYTFSTGHAGALSALVPLSDVSSSNRQVTIIFHGNVVASCQYISTSEHNPYAGGGTTQITNCGDTPAKQ